MAIGTALSTIGAGLGAASAAKNLFGSSSKAGGAGTAADPNTYFNIRLPGVQYPAGMEGSLVDLPQYPTLPGYNFSRAPSAIPGREMPYQPTSLYKTATLGELGMESALSSQSRALKAILDRNSPEYKQLVEEEAQLGRQDVARGIRDLMTASQRASASGRQPLFSGERGSEQILRAISEGTRASEQGARNSARDILSAIATAYGNLAQGRQSQAGVETARRDLYGRDLATRIQQLRQDMASRNQEKRAEYLDTLAQERSDILDKFNTERSDILNALNIYRGNTSTIQSAQADAQQQNLNRSLLQGQALSAGIEQIGNLFSNKNGGLMSWL